MIGVNLRDTYGVGKSHYLTGSKILRVLKSMGAAPELPEDIYFMIKKAVGMRKHLDRNRKVIIRQPLFINKKIQSIVIYFNSLFRLTES